MTATQNLVKSAQTLLRFVHIGLPAPRAGEVDGDFLRAFTAYRYWFFRSRGARPADARKWALDSTGKVNSGWYAEGDIHRYTEWEDLLRTARRFAEWNVRITFTVE